MAITTAQPSVTLHKASALFDIAMDVTNLASVPMPLQYMCHMNYAYVPQATFSQNIPDEALTLRESIPAHVKPTEQWLAFNRRVQQGEATVNALTEPEFYDPEIVFFADRLDRHTDKPEFCMHAPDGTIFVTRFPVSSLITSRAGSFTTAISRSRRLPFRQPVAPRGFLLRSVAAVYSALRHSKPAILASPRALPDGLT